MSWRIVKGNGIELPDLGWHLDAQRPVGKSFVSHAHFDHMGDHRTILCSRPTATLIKARLAGERDWRIYDFGEPFELEPGISGCLYPAGHIIGSAMLRIQAGKESLLYTGDFKLTAGISAERCQPVSAGTLIVETTYGLPRYVFPAEAEVMADIARFCRETLENGDTPVLFGYSLGKSQAILRSLADSGLKTMLHPQCLKMTESCKALGWEFPAHSVFQESEQAGHVLICPPMTKDSPWLRRIRNPKTAIISGWALDSSAVYRYQCDKAFPLSDHADYLDLQSFVAQVNPKTVYTVHGFATEFAATLREQGYQALALGYENQLNLAIETPTPATEPLVETSVSAPDGEAFPANGFIVLANLVSELGGTDSSSRKVELIADYLRPLATEDAAIAALFLTGRAFPRASEAKPDIGWSQVRQAALYAARCSEADYKLLYQSFRDGPETVAQLLGRAAPPPTRALKSQRSFFDAFAAAPSPAFKRSFLGEEFRKLALAEAKLIVRLLAGDLRAGVTETIVEEAVARVFATEPEAVRRANLRCGDISAVVQAAAQNALDQVEIALFRPLQFMLPRAATDATEAIERHGLAVWAEDKYDGARCQLHKVGERVELFGIDGCRITHQFPEIVEAARFIPEDFIGDGVIVPWGYERPLPAEELTKRLRRKGEDLFLGEEIPVILWLYDVLWMDGHDLLDVPLEQRRSKLDTLSTTPGVRLAPVSTLAGVDAIDRGVASSVARGNAGLVIKDARSPYRSGERSADWLTLAIPAGGK